MFTIALTLALAGTHLITKAYAAGAFAIGKCGAYGEAYDYAAEAAVVAKAIGGNKAAGTRGRKKMQDIKSAAQDVRKKILEGREAEPDVAAPTPPTQA